MFAAEGQAPAAQMKIFQPDCVPFSSFHSVHSVFFHIEIIFPSEIHIQM